MSLPNPIVLLDARAKYVHPAFEMSRASTKTVFDSSGRLVTVPANALGWDHDPATGQTRGYLAEPSATNLLLHSNDLTQGAWTTNNASITPSVIDGPDGEGMDKLVENNNNSQHFIYQDITIADGATMAFSVVVKMAERDELRWEVNNTGIGGVLRVDLLAGEAVNPVGGAGAELVGYGAEPLGTGFYRLWIAGSFPAGVASVRAVAFLRAGQTSVYQGDGTSGLYLGYAQAEPGSYPTSYIETAGATATRAGDALAAPGGYGWWRDDRGTLLVECEVPHSRTSGYLLSLAGSAVQLRWSGGTDLIINSSALGGSAQILTPGAAPGRHLIAFGWGDDWVVAADGGIAAAGQMAGSMPMSPAIGIGARSDGLLPFGGYVRRAVYYPQRISNADLQSLTAIQE